MNKKTAQKNHFLNRDRVGAYKPVFIPALVILLALAIFGIVFPSSSARFFAMVQHNLVTRAGWLYILGMAIFLCVCVYLMCSRLGETKLGPDHSVPDYSNFSWFSMLFAAGMGIGLMFFSVAEPLQHYASPPLGSAQTVAAAQSAINITFFHWGLQAWSVYAIVSLSLAYFAYRHKLPLLPRSGLYPLLGRRIFGWPGHLVDIFAIVGTTVGIATSLGLGVHQLNSGLHYLFGVSISPLVQIILIIVITGLATLSVALGLDKGIKFLSNLNVLLAIFLVLAILLFSDTVGLLQDFVQNTGHYFSTLVNKTFNLYAYHGKQDWMGSWTLFYWGWWIGWSPFVGMFIAKVSRGRTIREFLAGVLIVPVGFTFFWFTVFGNSAFSLVDSGKAPELINLAQHHVPIALFAFLHHFPFSGFLSSISLLLIVTFFVTSADSGALVIDILATANAKTSILWQRVFWAVLVGLFAISLLMSNSLVALQTAAIASAFPFLFVVVLMAVSLILALKKDHLRENSIQNHFSTIQFETALTSWKTRLSALLRHSTPPQVREFLKNHVYVAFEKVADELTSQQQKAEFSLHKNHAEFIIRRENSDDDFYYSVHLTAYNSAPYSEANSPKRNPYCRAEVFLSNGNQNYSIIGYTTEQIITDLVTQYEKHLYFLHVSDAEVYDPA